jgi:hypothetical protein
MSVFHGFHLLSIRDNGCVSEAAVSRQPEPLVNQSDNPFLAERRSLILHQVQ